MYLREIMINGKKEWMKIFPIKIKYLNLNQNKNQAKQ